MVCDWTELGRREASVAAPLACGTFLLLAVVISSSLSGGLFPAPPSNQFAQTFSTILRDLYIDGDSIWTVLLSTNSHPGEAVVVEVGIGGSGNRSMQCAQAVELKFGRVVCFEPSIKNVAKFKEIQRKRFAGASNIELVEKAVSDVTGNTLQFSSKGTNSDHVQSIQGQDELSRGNTIKVKTISLDDAFPSEHIYLVKIDTQGYDGSVLRGMKEMLSARRVKYVLFELWPVGMRDFGKYGCKETLEYLMGFSYTMYETIIDCLIQGRQAPCPMKTRNPHYHNPTELCNWYFEHGDAFGSWTDVLLVRSDAMQKV
jgi:FkbM family methyltransferase